VLNQTEYKKATAAVKVAGYATDVSYPEKLNKLIEQYELTKYDKDGDDVVKIALDAGHGINTAGKRTPDGEREWLFNSKVLLACSARLNKYEDVQILRLDDPTGNTDVPLAIRTNKANSWGADALVSIHHNANTGKWGNHGGTETFVHPTASRASFDIAEIIQRRIVKAMGLRNRGVKTDNLHMLRESNMPAILTEGGFMDSTTDIGTLRSESKLKVQGEEIAEGLATYFKMKPKIARETNPITPKKKGENKLYEPTSKTIIDATESVLKQLEKKEDGGLSSQWRKKLTDDTLTDSDALGLIYVSIERGVLNGQK